MSLFKKTLPSKIWLRIEEFDFIMKMLIFTEIPCRMYTNTIMYAMHRNSLLTNIFALSHERKSQFLSENLRELDNESESHFCAAPV